MYLTGDLASRRSPRRGPDALEISPEDFRHRLRAHRGEIKGFLIRASFLAGIGNAYADEILWQARLHPYRRRSSLTPKETGRVFEAMRTTLQEATAQVCGEGPSAAPRGASRGQG